jgi:hypothetical protein
VRGHNDEHDDRHHNYPRHPAARADLSGSARFQIAPPMATCSIVNSLGRHLWRLTKYGLKRRLWRIILTLGVNTPF